VNEFSRTRAALEAGIKERLHPGAQVFVSVGGEVLLDEALGEARDGAPMRRDSIVLWFSAGKPLTAAAVGRLVEQGAFTWDTPVCKLVPEFAQNGKEIVTIRHLLTHTAGLRHADAVDESLNWDEKLAWICGQPFEAGWVPGERAGYHVTGTWYVLGEIVRRVSRRPVDEFVRAQVFQPLGMSHSFLALSDRDAETLRDRISFVYETSAGAPVAKAEWNSADGLTRCRPGGSARGPVRELGRFYEALLRGGAGVLRPETVQAMTARQRVGMFDETFQFKMDWGLGFILNSNRDGFQMPYGYGRHASCDTFGHSGNQISCAFADPQHQLVVAWACNGMPGERKHQQRQRAINNAIYEDLGFAPSAQATTDLR